MEFFSFILSTVLYFFLLCFEDREWTYFYFRSFLKSVFASNGFYWFLVVPYCVHKNRYFCPLKYLKNRLKVRFLQLMLNKLHVILIFHISTKKNGKWKIDTSFEALVLSKKSWILGIYLLQVSFLYIALTFTLTKIM